MSPERVVFSAAHETAADRGSGQGAKLAKLAVIPALDGTCSAGPIAQRSPPEPMPSVTVEVLSATEVLGGLWLIRKHCYHSVIDGSGVRRAEPARLKVVRSMPFR